MSYKIFCLLSILTIALSFQSCDPAGIIKFVNYTGHPVQVKIVQSGRKRYFGQVCRTNYFYDDSINHKNTKYLYLDTINLSLSPDSTVFFGHSMSPPWGDEDIISLGHSVSYIEIKTRTNATIYNDSIQILNFFRNNLKGPYNIEIDIQ